MDDEIYGNGAAESIAGHRRANPVSDQISLLKTVFAHG
jgi:hypothetical protein